jgi:hypothetical protein
MYLPIQPLQICTQACLAAAIIINQAGKEAYAVIINVGAPFNQGTS